MLATFEKVYVAASLCRALLTRSHAMLVVRDQHVDRIFELWSHHTRISEESYIPTLLQTYNLTSEVRLCGWMLVPGLSSTRGGSVTK